MHFNFKWKEIDPKWKTYSLAACVASDAHTAWRRTTDMTEIRRYLLENFGEGYMRLLLEINPERIINGEELLGYEPVPFD